MTLIFTWKKTGLLKHRENLRVLNADIVPVFGGIYDQNFSALFRVYDKPRKGWGQGYLLEGERRRRRRRDVADVAAGLAGCHLAPLYPAAALAARPAALLLSGHFSQVT